MTQSPRSRARSTLLGAQAAELAMAVPQVVAHRVARMALAGAPPSARDRKEFHRMGTEKTAAFAEAWQAMAWQALRAQQTLTVSMMQSFWAPHSRSGWATGAVAAQMHSFALGVLGKGLAPVHRRVVANAKRLARTPLR